MYVLFKHMYMLDRCWLQTTYLQVHQSSRFFFKEYTHVFYIDYFYKFVLDKKKSPTFLEFLAFLLSVNWNKNVYIEKCF